MISSVLRRPVWVWYLAVGTALTALYMFVPPLKGNGPLINVLGLSGVVAIVVGIRMHKPRARAAWWLFAAGQFLSFSGDIYTSASRPPVTVSTWRSIPCSWPACSCSSGGATRSPIDPH